MNVAGMVDRYRVLRRRHELRDAVQTAHRVLEMDPEGPRDSRVRWIALNAKAFGQRELGLSEVPLRWAKPQSWWGTFVAPPPRILIASDIGMDRVESTVFHELAHAWSWARDIPDTESQARAIASYLTEKWENR